MKTESSVYYDPQNVPHDIRDFDNIPAELRELPQWIMWRIETNDEGRIIKQPLTISGCRTDVTNGSNWTTFKKCIAALRTGKFGGIGFVFSPHGDYTGIDLDDHREPVTGELDSFAADYVARLNSYTEASQSGTGVHIIVKGKLPGDKGRRDSSKGVEMYSQARYFIMTGNHVPGTPRTVEERQSEVESMFNEVFPPKQQPPPVATPPPIPPAPAKTYTLTAPSATLTDDDIINKASRATNGAKFSALWRGDFAAAGFGSQSEADAALLDMLGFWTGRDKARSFRMFSQSGLNRAKWQREDYRESTWALVAGGESYKSDTRTGGSLSKDQTEATTTATTQLPAVKRLNELVKRIENDPAELLRTGYLCRGGGAIWVAQTGIGKSVLEMQAAILWAIGKPFFGITPTRPLKSLIIQAENDDGDLAEFRDGIIIGLRLTAEEIKLVSENVLVVTEDTRTGLPLCLYTVNPLLEKHRPDILWLDPANSYIGGDVNSQEIVGGFLRNMLNPLLRKHGCAGIIVHHTTKPPKDKTEWSGGDFAYLGAGSAEFANWARAVIAIRSTKTNGVFELRAGKRGARIGWKNEEGGTDYTRMIAHSNEPGLIYWRDVEPGEVETANQINREKTVEDLLAHVPTDKPILKNILVEKLRAKGFGKHAVAAILDKAIDDEAVYVWKKKRPGTNPAKLIARQPQPQGGE